MRNALLDQSYSVIADMLEGRRIAEGGSYQVLWIKDHFEVRKTNQVDKESFLIIKLFAGDINKGLTNTQWQIVLSRLRTLIETEVIK